MLLPDINALIYAHRSDSPEHQRYSDWLVRLVESPSPFGLSDFVMTGFVRIVTNRRVFREPTPRTVAVDFLANLLSQPNCVMVLPSSRQWRLMMELCEQADVVGPLVSDAYLAAQAIDHGCELVTTDSDFARFQGLRWSHPLAARES
ncbi:MAG: type II toxin-antitoxin system VapC family toxin [Armatimonadetes bacterium]|nr:type II toxin-antitoxin system VapC family toxin [Armatimonadota bacterium]